MDVEAHDEEPQPAELRIERRGCVVHIDGEPALWLETPIATRPQDWAPAARAMLFGDRLDR